MSLILKFCIIYCVKLYNFPYKTAKGNDIELRFFSITYEKNIFGFYYTIIFLLHLCFIYNNDINIIIVIMLFQN